MLPVVKKLCFGSAQTCESNSGEFFPYDANKTTIGKLAEEFDMEPMSSQNCDFQCEEKISQDYTDPDLYRNEEFYFDNRFATSEMNMQYAVQLSSCLPCQFAGQVVTINETREFNELMETIVIENSQNNFLLDQYEYRPKVSQ